MTGSSTRPLRRRLVLLALGLCGAIAAVARETPAPTFHVAAFYTDGVEEAHLSFVREANRWFGEMARQDGFSYEATGTGPKPHEIWREGDYPVVWTNRNYRMAYLNMGHNDLGGEGRTLSSTFASATQNQLMRQLLYWVAGHEPPLR